MLPQLKLLSKTLALLSTSLIFVGFSPIAQAANWSDTSISWRASSQFAEPFNNKDIHKNIVAFTHASGYNYGSNFLNVDWLMSDSNDPSAAGSSSGAQEVYVVYRHTLDIGKILSKDIKFGPVRGLGLTARFDFNNKGDAGYNSKKRMWVLGPMLMMDVPGFLNISLLLLKESNNPSASAGAFDPGYPGSRYTYKTHPMLTAAWGVPITSWPLSFEGFANFIAAKGKDELGNDTAAETNIDMQVMYDLSSTLNAAKNTFRVGLEYQYWNNKFGNSDATVGSFGGNQASTPMIRVDCHF